MQALTILRPGTAALTEKPVPVPGHGEVVVGPGDLEVMP